MPWEYLSKPNKQIEDWYDAKVRKGEIDFIDFEDFSLWYEETVKDKACYYCGLTERESQQIIHLGVLTSKRFPLGGIFARGVNRGYWLEIDRKQPNGNYSRLNCVPACVFCNNDKSDVFTDQQYSEFVADRIGFLRRMINNIE